LTLWQHHACNAACQQDIQERADDKLKKYYFVGLVALLQ